MILHVGDFAYDMDSVSTTANFSIFSDKPVQKKKIDDTVDR